MAVLLLALTIINAAAIWGIISARRSAESIALQDLKLETTAHARSLEAVLSSRRADFIFLSKSPPLSGAHSLLKSSNPIIRRWGRLDVEGSLLLFLVAHPEVERILIRDSDSQPLLAVGRRDGAPILLPSRDFASAAAAGDGLLVGLWPIRSSDGGSGTLETVLNVATLLRVAAPGIGPQFVLRQQEVAPAQTSSKGSNGPLVVSSPVRDDGWPNPIRWSLVCEENPSHLVASVKSLANRYRATVIANLIVMSLALLLGVIGFAHVRRTMALEAMNRQQARVRELERQVMHNERLASVGRLAAGMAHEINNPLEGMSNYLGLLEEDLRGCKAKDSLVLVGNVREGLERVAGIIRQVLTFSDPGGAPRASLDLNEVLEETIAFVRSNPNFRQMAVVLRTSGTELRILGNRVTLGQLFLNLLMNACQVQPEGGQIEVASLEDGGRAVVLVADCGPGIPEDVLPRIFEPFYSTRGSTGLGLAVCHGIVEEHWGKIQAFNRLGGGAVFQVEIPLQSSLPAQQELEASSPGIQG